MSEYIISEYNLNNLKKALDVPYCFDCDGCNCGGFTFKLEENLYFSIYRSCHKSSSTPNNMSWKLHEPYISSKHIEENGNEYFSSVDDLDLNEEQKKQLVSFARIRTIRDIGYDEHGNYMDLEEIKETNRWYELKQNILNEKNKIENSDDILQHIFENILRTMDELEEI
jgi:hypothetical protein